MAKNIIDKIWDKHVVKQNPGHPAIFAIDLQLTHEVTSPQGFAKLREKGLRVKFPHKQIATLDHSIPTRQDRENIHDPIARKQVETLRKNVKDFGITMFDYDSGHQGIVHVIGPELGLTQPGMTIVCGDSHTSTHGAFGALAFGVGSTEVGLVMATGCILQEKPKTFRVEFKGSFPKGVYSKDAILYLISKIGVGGGNGYVMEFCGQAVEEMSMQARMSMCNMSIEGGARAGVVQPDLKTIEWVLGLREGELSENEKFKLEGWQAKSDEVFTKAKNPSEYQFDPNFCLEFEDYKIVPISLHYAEEVFQSFTDEISHFIIPKSFKDLEEVNEFIKKAIQDNQANKKLQLLILHKNNQFIGGINLKKIQTKTPEFGIWIKKEYHGKKIGKKAITTLKNWAEQNFDYDYFIYPVDKNNIPSRKIPESLGGEIIREYQEVNQSGKTLNLIEFRIANTLKVNKNWQNNILQLTLDQKNELKRLYEKAKERGSLRKYTPKFEDWERAIIHWLSFRSDENAKYDKEIVIDASKLKPMITWGTNPAQGMFIDEAIPDYEKQQFEKKFKSLTDNLANVIEEAIQKPQEIILGNLANNLSEELKLDSNPNIVLVSGSRSFGWSHNTKHHKDISILDYAEILLLTVFNNNASIFKSKSNPKKFLVLYPEFDNFENLTLCKYYLDENSIKLVSVWKAHKKHIVSHLQEEDIAEYLDIKKLPSREAVNSLIPAISGLPATFPGFLKEDNKKNSEFSQKSQEQQKALKYTKLKPGQKLLGQPIDWVFLGSCTNSRMEDLEIAAGIFYEDFNSNPDWLKTFDPSKVKKVAQNVTMYIVPGSEMVKKQAEELGLDKIFKAAGADWRMPGCSMCLGMNDDKVPTGKRCLSTSNRNFMHRQGPGSITHLCSPATATISAIKGKIDYLKN